ncbi:MAG: ribonuclease P protein component [Nodosilinea sp.]
MLPKRYRLRQSRDFSQVYRYGQKAVSAHLVVRVMKGGGIPTQDAQPLASKPEPPAPAMIGIVVSLKVSKRAVVRNRLKRQIRAALRVLLPRLTSPAQIVISVRPEASQCGYAEFLRELEALLTKLEVIHGHS